MKLKSLHLINFLSHKDSFIDFDKIDSVALILGAKNVTRDFKVHKDGRLKIHYGYVGFGSFVDVSVENGKLKFA